MSRGMNDHHARGLAETSDRLAEVCGGADRTALQVDIAQAGPIPLQASFSCAAGELIALVGPSGSGKTSVLRAIAGLMRPLNGRIVCASDVWFASWLRVHVPPQDRRVGLVFQDYALFPHLTALENVVLASDPNPEPERSANARALLARVNLEGLEDRRPSQLSGGQRQRVALARALARRPNVLLLDEPFSAVDQATRGRLKRELVGLRATLEIPIVLVTHDIDEAYALADRIVVLYRGRTLAAETPEAIRLRPPSPLVARLMGQTNLFSGVVESRSGGVGQAGVLRWDGGRLEVSDTCGLAVGARVSWLVPDDQIVMHRRGRPSLGERENPLAGKVTALVVLGPRAEVSLSLSATGDAGHSVNFSVPTHVARRNDLHVGAQVVVSLLADGIHLMPDSEM